MENETIKKEGSNQSVRATGLAFVTVGLFLLFNQTFIGNQVIANSLAIFLTGVGYSLFIMKDNENEGQMFGSAALILTLWGIVHYLNTINNWPHALTISINIIGLIPIYLIAGFFWIGIIMMAENFGILISKFENKKSKGAALKILFRKFAHTAILAVLLFLISKAMQII